MAAPILETERLILRQWKQGDLPEFARMNGDERVMEFFPSTLSVEESNQLAERIQQELQEKEYGLWAVEVKGGASFVGFVGLRDQDFPAPFTPCIEIGWRLSFDHWGNGYAFEAASRITEYALQEIKLKEIVSFTSSTNTRSRKLMEKLGMTYNPQDDFDHSKLPNGHPLQPHVLYRFKLCN